MDHITLHYGSVAFALATDSAVQDIASQISAAVQQGGAFVTLHTLDGSDVSVLFTSGIPVWFAESNSPRQSAPTRIR